MSNDTNKIGPYRIATDTNGIWYLWQHGKRLGAGHASYEDVARVARQQCLERHAKEVLHALEAILAFCEKHMPEHISENPDGDYAVIADKALTAIAFARGKGHE